MATDHRYPLVLSSFATLVLAACGGGGSGGSRQADSTPPTVVSTGPANAATGVPVDGTITATFSEPMAPASITETTFTVSGAGASVSGIVSSSGATATFRPRGLLAFATTYTAAITRGATDVAANPLAANFSWAFTTPPPPAAPAANAGPNQDVDASATVALDGTGSHADSGFPLTYTWTQVFGPDVTGGTHTLSGANPTFSAPADVSALQFDLVVNDRVADSAPARVQINVLEDKTKAVFVAKTGSDTAAGTRAAPLLTIQAAIDKATPDGADVYVGAGTYSESLRLAPGVSVHGGFDAGWLRDIAASVTTVAGGPRAVVGQNLPAFTSDGRPASLTVDGVTVTSADATGAGTSSYGFLLANSAGVKLTHDIIIAGNGAAGAAGSAGPAGSAAQRGNDGSSGCVDSNCVVPGGTAGVGRGGPGGAGGAGHFAANGSNGDGAPLGFPDGRGGQGGPVGNPGGSGTTGFGGTNGVGGSNGVAGATFGQATANGYLPANGSAGGAGTAGTGGGGGGAGGGQTCFFCIDGTGNGGGGGGGGGGAGGGGGGGQGGGGSFGIYSFHSTVIETDNVIVAGAGGAGAAGGTGGAGGAGGAGGSGATAGPGEIGAGGAGGAGGRGGNGGHGGAGGLGPSMTVFTGG